MELLAKLRGKSRSSGAALPLGWQGKGKRKQPTRREVLALRPCRNPALEWFEADGHVVLHIKRVHNWKTRLLELFLPLPDEQRIVLDPIGTDVWQMMDGQTSIGAIAKKLAAKYKLTSREAELSVQQFFKELGRRGYVGFVMDESKSR
ncbi:MAG: PqqD family protein [Armatimonadota bacterium]|nr:PqqD family protein [Armatimonadota bacterium]